MIEWSNVEPTTSTDTGHCCNILHCTRTNVELTDIKAENVRLFLRLRLEIVCSMLAALDTFHYSVLY